MAAHPSTNRQTVSPRTLTAEIRCHHWKPAETLCRGKGTCRGVKRVPGAPRGLSRLISVADQWRKGRELRGKERLENRGENSGAQCRESGATVSLIDRWHLVRGTHRECIGTVSENQRRTVRVENCRTVRVENCRTVRVENCRTVRVENLTAQTVENLTAQTVENLTAQTVENCERLRVENCAHTIGRARLRRIVTIRHIGSAYGSHRPGLWYACTCDSWPGGTSTPVLSAELMLQISRAYGTSVLCDSSGLAQVQVYYSTGVL
jgi:hypothetical protein